MFSFCFSFDLPLWRLLLPLCLHSATPAPRLHLAEVPHCSGGPVGHSPHCLSHPPDAALHGARLHRRRLRLPLLHPLFRSADEEGSEQAEDDERRPNRLWPGRLLPPAVLLPGGGLVRGLCHLVAANQHLVSPLLFAAFLSNFLFLNLHLVRSLFFLSAAAAAAAAATTMTPFDRALVIALVALQALFALVPVQAMVRLGADLLRPGWLLGQVQLLLLLMMSGSEGSADKNKRSAANRWQKAVFFPQQRQKTVDKRQAEGAASLWAAAQRRRVPLYGGHAGHHYQQVGLWGM